MGPRCCPHPLDIGSVLLHGDLLQGALKAKERADIQRGGLFKASPVFILGMDLQNEKRPQYGDAVLSARVLLDCHRRHYAPRQQYGA